MSRATNIRFEQEDSFFCKIPKTYDILPAERCLSAKIMYETEPCQLEISEKF